MSDFDDENNCVQLSTLNTYQWSITDCNILSRFICNSCDNKLNKYIGITDTDLYWIDSEDYCVNTLGTNLASLHSERDFQESLNVCDDSYCHIGLNDRDNEMQFEWTDETTFDYASDISGAVYPWHVFFYFI